MPATDKVAISQWQCTLYAYSIPIAKKEDAGKCVVAHAFHRLKTGFTCSLKGRNASGSEV